MDFADLFDSDLSGLSADEVLRGLLDHGLFGEKAPPCFSSAGLAAVATTELAAILDLTDEQKLFKAVGSCAHDYIRYEALRDINIPRHLGIPHPESYSLQALAISRHWAEIKAHCGLPNPKMSRVYVRHVGEGKIFEMNYKGSERYQHEEDEIQWMSSARFVAHADVAACFPSIYTHAIPWALHEKTVAKTNKSLKLCGNLLDRCTQNTRDGQTNGLLIGPHASNIISEIVLTQVDLALQAAGFTKITRHIDDYVCYTDSYEEAERFIKTLGRGLRNHEMSLNEKKTRVLPLPRPSEEDWVQSLVRFAPPQDGEITFSAVRSFLDLALEAAQSTGKSTPLNYAIKILAGKKKGLLLNDRAKRLYLQEAINLALAYPYLVPILDVYVFDRYPHDQLSAKVAVFSSALIKLGIARLYPDTVAYALFYALKHDVALDVPASDLLEVIQLDDCIANVMLLEYVSRHDLKVIVKAIKKRAAAIKTEDSRSQDKNWLLIYQLWSEADLTGKGQSFLATLKKMNFKFLSFPKAGNAVESLNAPKPH